MTEGKPHIGSKSDAFEVLSLMEARGSLCSIPAVTRNREGLKGCVFALHNKGHPVAVSSLLPSCRQNRSGPAMVIAMRYGP